MNVQDLIAQLRVAAELEHSIGLQYIYAAFSLKPAHDAYIGTPRPGPDTLLGLALEEMHHLRWVNDILSDLGAPPHLGHPTFPYEPKFGTYSFTFDLEPLSKRSLAKYMFAEAPPLAETNPSLLTSIKEDLGTDKLANANIGSLYRSLIDSVASLPEPQPLRQVWIDVLNRIREQGEEGHFELLYALRYTAELDWEATDGRYPALPLPTNPTAEAPSPTLEGEALDLARIGNRVYWAVLHLLGVGYHGPGADQLHARSVDLMVWALLPIARTMAEMQAGLPFEPQPAPSDYGLDAATAVLHEARTTTLRSVTDAALRRRLADALSDTLHTLEVVATEREHRREPREGEIFVVGAGPGGFAAATALARQQLPVTLIEHAMVTGGKAWSYQRRDDEPAREHGVHGWWPGYVNFDRLLQSAGVDVAAALGDAGGSAVIGPRRDLIPITRLSLPIPSPIHVFLYALRLGILSIVDLLSSLRFFLHVIAFDHEQDYRRYDDESFSALMDRLGVARRVQRYILGPFAIGFDYGKPDEVSASSVLSALQFYLLPSKDRIVPRWPTGLPDDVIFEPLREAFRRAGGVLWRGVELDRLVVEQGRITGVMVRDSARPAPRRAATEGASVQLVEIPEDAFIEIDSASLGPILLRRVGAGVRAFSARCPHRGDRVAWDAASCRFRCRGHGTVFGSDGRHQEGPATAGLRALSTVVDADQTAVSVFGPPSVRRLPCEDVILATDVRRARAVLERTPDVPGDLRKRLEALRATSVLVVRLWFSPQVEAPPYETIVIPEGVLADVYFNLGEIDAAMKREGLVVELHSTDRNGAWSAESDEVIGRAALADLRAIAESFAHAEPRAVRVQRHTAIFTAYEPGRDTHRPGAASGVEGLFLAGDWTKADWSVWMMERAVVSGLRAANRVLARRGRAAVGIERPPPDDRLLRLGRWICRRLLRR